jgi:serine/threonine-protein kinase HipA
MSPLDKLWYAGDRRFGALGMSSSFDEYRPVEAQPLMSVDSLPEAEALIARVRERDPFNDARSNSSPVRAAWAAPTQDADRGRW